MICERNYALTVLFRHREEVFQDAHSALTQLRFHVVENQVRVLLWHGSDVGNIVTHNNVWDVEIGRRTVRKMADDEGIWLTTVLVNDYKVCHAVWSAGREQLFHFVVTPVESLGIGENKTQLLKNAINLVGMLINEWIDDATHFNKHL